MLFHFLGQLIRISFANELFPMLLEADKKGESILVIDASNQKLRIAGVFQSKW